MSTIKNVDVKLNNGRKFNVHVESYRSAQDVVDDCMNRTNHDYENMRNHDMDIDWHGVHNYDEALDLMKGGYQPVVEKLQEALKANKLGNGKRIKFENNVHGFAPIVPLALKGVPNSMVNMTMKPIKCKVVDVYYDMGVHCGVTPEEIIECGQKLLGTIIELEKQGYKFNLYALQGYANGTESNNADILCVKVKSSDKPLDLKRISFPLTHPAFFRVIGFDWQGKSPATRYRGSGRGRAISSELSKENVDILIKKVFGDNALYLSCYSLQQKDEEHIKEVLVG